VRIGDRKGVDKSARTVAVMGGGVDGAKPHFASPGETGARLPVGPRRQGGSGKRSAPLLEPARAVRSRTPKPP